MAPVLLNLASHPLTLLWILAVHGRMDREQQSDSYSNMRCIMASRQNSVLAIYPLCLPPLRQRHVGKLYYSFSDNTPCSTRVDMLATGDVPILISLPQIQNLGMTLEPDPKGAKIT